MYTYSDLPKYPPVLFVRLADLIRRSLIRMSRRFTHPSVEMMEHLQNLWLIGSISAVNELGIADILRAGPQNIEELASLTGTHEDPLYRVMRMLSSQGIFRETGDRIFSNTPVSSSMREKELKYFIQHTLNSMQFRIFGALMHSLKTGRRASELFVETNVFAHIGSSVELNELYNRAMTNTSRMQVAAILSAFSFSKFRIVVDVGGGQGFFLSALLSKYPGMRGILFDLPNVVGNPEKLPSDFGGRLKVEAGSFLETIPSGGDLYTLKNILHGWTDNDCLTILGNIRKVIGGQGRIMIIEAVVEGRNTPSWGKMSDIFMMAGPDGKERTREEFRILLEKSGFSIERIKKTVAPLSLIIAAPK
ncbi:MAG: hypothetical protein MUE74_05835 [Bacteroidales bacterium]|jgi:hypothetical protein|nr:hypothetical protein [Bacteroidales bacterium]